MWLAAKILISATLLIWITRSGNRRALALLERRLGWALPRP
jgi:hypothetical protein